MCCRTVMTQNYSKPLRGQRAIVTGASRGIGRAVAAALAQAGADVIVNYSGQAAEAESAAGEIRSYGVRCFAHRADVSNEAEVEHMFERARGEFGTIDILIANAGLQRDAPIAT